MCFQIHMARRFDTGITIDIDRAGVIQRSIRFLTKNTGDQRVVINVSVGRNGLAGQFLTRIHIEVTIGNQAAAIIERHIVAIGHCGG